MIVVTMAHGASGSRAVARAITSLPPLASDWGIGAPIANVVLGGAFNSRRHAQREVDDSDLDRSAGSTNALTRGSISKSAQWATG